LVKNDIFSRALDASEDHLKQLDVKTWAPFFKGFANDSELLEGYFFPYQLIHDSNVKKSQVYLKMQKSWEAANLKPEEVVSRLSIYQKDYMDVCFDDVKYGGEHPKEVRDRFEALRELGQPKSTYPFLMRLSHAIQEKEVSKKDGIQALELIESFLVRRAACGYAPTGLHAVFKRLWDDQGDPKKAKSKSFTKRLAKVIRDHSTVEWPNDSEFRTKLAERSLYGARVTPYILLEWDRHKGSERPSNNYEVEHMLPQTPSAKCWTDIWTSKDMEAATNQIGNLTLLSEGMNRSLKNVCWEVKRKTYRDESMYTSTRLIGRYIKEWTPAAHAKRTKDITSWALTRWELPD